VARHPDFAARAERRGNDGIVYSGYRMSEDEMPVALPQDPEEMDLADEQVPVPPATSEYLVATMRFQVEMQLGYLHFGEEKDRPEPNLELARHFIDMLAMLQEKTRGNLSLEEKRMLENTITELRFRYVQTADQSVQA